MEKMEYSNLEQIFPTVFHLLCLIYSHSEAYAKPVRVITLIKVVLHCHVNRPLYLVAEYFQLIPNSIGDQQSHHRENNQVPGLLFSLSNRTRGSF